MPGPIGALAWSGIGVAGFAAFVKLLQNISEQSRGELRVQVLQLLRRNSLASLVRGESGRFYIDYDKLPNHKDWEERFEVQYED